MGSEPRRVAEGRLRESDSGHFGLLVAGIMGSMIGFGALSLVAALLLAGGGSAQNDLTEVPNRACLHGLPDVRVRVLVEGNAVAFSRQSLLAYASLPLREAGIPLVDKVDPAGADLDVFVSRVSADDGFHSALSVRIECVRPGSIPSNPDAVPKVLLWENSTLLSIAGSKGSHQPEEEALKTLVTMFANDYLAENPKS